MMEHGHLDQSDDELQPTLNQSEASVASGPLLEDSSFRNVSRLPAQYLASRHSLTSGPLEDAEEDGHEAGGVGLLDVSRASSSSSSRPNVLDKYLLSQSSQSIDNFLTPSLGSVQVSGGLDILGTREIYFLTLRISFQPCELFYPVWAAGSLHGAQWGPGEWRPGQQ